VVLANGERLVPDPILVGRNAERIRAISPSVTASRAGRTISTRRSPTPRHGVLRRRHHADARRPARTRARAGKHVYCEKPTSDDLDTAVALARTARASGLKHGVVQDKLFLPGLMKLAMLRDSGFFGRMLSVRGEFGYWVFEGDWQAAQRPSWNYRLADGGGIILDMLCHWRYVLDSLFGAGARGLLPRRDPHPRALDEAGKPYPADADDAAYATFELEGGVIAQINSSWAVRVRRDDLVTFQVDGTHGSAVAGLHKCWTQHRVNTPKPVWNPDQPQTMDFFAHGRRCRTTGRPRTASRRNGRCSCAMSPRTGPGPTGWRRAPAACSSPRSACSPGASGAGSTCPISGCDPRRLPPMTADAPRLRITSAEAFERPVAFRFPFRFGAARVAEASQAFLRVEIADGAGTRATGWAAEMMMPKWFDKTPTLSAADNADQLRHAIRTATALGLDAGPDTAFGLHAALEPAQHAACARAGLPALVASFGLALLDRAVIDALCRLTGLPAAAMVRANLPGIDARTAPDLAGFDLDAFLRARPAPAHIAARHTVGLGDALTDAEIEAPLSDGLPQSLEAVIAAYGHRVFKLKVSGDVAADLDRLGRIAAVLDTQAPAIARRSTATSSSRTRARSARCSTASSAGATSPACARRFSFSSSRSPAPRRSGPTCAALPPASRSRSTNPTATSAPSPPRAPLATRACRRSPARASTAGS
jgi:hypothetical protein